MPREAARAAGSCSARRSTSEGVSHRRIVAPTILDRLAADGYGVIGGVGEYEHVWRMASVRGPEGIIVNLAERTG